jgi:hypothetical protein
MIGVKLSNRVRNEVIKENCGCKEDVVTEIEKNIMLEWFGCVERMNEKRLTKKRFMSRIWVKMLEGKDVGERFLTKLDKF